jgi:hypothetical protein
MFDKFAIYHNHLEIRFFSNSEFGWAGRIMQYGLIYQFRAPTIADSICETDSHFEKNYGSKMIIINQKAYQKSV